MVPKGPSIYYVVEKEGGVGGSEKPQNLLRSTTLEGTGGQTKRPPVPFLIFTRRHLYFERSGLANG